MTWRELLHMWENFVIVESTIMKDNIISYNGFSHIVAAGRSLGTISPVLNISGPTTTLFYDLRGSATYTSTPSLAMGTLDRWRIDANDPLALNRDQYIFYSTGTQSLIRIVEREKNQISCHWTDKLPVREVGGYPDWVKCLVDDRIKHLKVGEKE